MRRWLADDVLKPWQYRSWIFPRDPHFAVKAGRVLDLYQREWGGRPLGENEYVLSADEKPGVQARMRIHLLFPPGLGRAIRAESEYHRHGTLAYLAAYDVHRARVFGRCEPSTGIKPFHLPRLRPADPQTRRADSVLPAVRAPRAPRLVRGRPHRCQKWRRHHTGHLPSRCHAPPRRDTPARGVTGAT